jgi:hypothetical protein
MTSKVFLFDNHNWLYCSGVSFKDGVWRGFVENGAWHWYYDSKTSEQRAYANEQSENRGQEPVTVSTTTLLWACDVPVSKSGRNDYNSVIARAEELYKSNEPSNFNIGPDKSFELYQKLKAKYENDDEYDLYLELCEKYEDDGIPF